MGIGSALDAPAGANPLVQSGGSLGARMQDGVWDRLQEQAKNPSLINALRSQAGGGDGIRTHDTGYPRITV